jgi:hypothetical protein
MSVTLRTTLATIDENGELRGMEKLENLRSQVVKIVVVTEPEGEHDDSDLTSHQWHRMVMQSSAFQEWADPVEDIYTLDDGKPFDFSQD